MIVVSISTTTAIVYAVSCSFFFLLIFLLVCMGLEPSQRKVLLLFNVKIINALNVGAARA